MVDVNKLDIIFSKIRANNEKPEKILIGYKVYAELMKDRRFFKEVVGSAMDPNKRKYKNVKINITQDKHQLEVRCSRE